MSSDLKQILQEAVTEALSKMGFEGSVEIVDSDFDFIIVKIQSDDAPLLIGQKGENLSALQYVVKLLVIKKIGAISPGFIVDVNNYRASRLSYIRDMALDAAREAEQERRVKFLEPMPPYERRLIHMVLKDISGIVTESQGQDPDRRIVIKPANEISG